MRMINTPWARLTSQHFAPAFIVLFVGVARTAKGYPLLLVDRQRLGLQHVSAQAGQPDGR